MSLMMQVELLFRAARNRRVHKRVDVRAGAIRLEYATINHRDCANSGLKPNLAGSDALIERGIEPHIGLLSRIVEIDRVRNRHEVEAFAS